MWALVFDARTNYIIDISGYNVVSIYRKPKPSPRCSDDFVWALKRPGEWSASELEDPIAIIHVGEIKATLESFKEFLLGIEPGPGASLDNPGNLSAWGPPAWVIRALNCLDTEFGKKEAEQTSRQHGYRRSIPMTETRFLACSPRAIHPNISNNLEMLKKEKRSLHPGRPVVRYTLKALYELGAMNR